MKRREINKFVDDHIGLLKDKKDIVKYYTVHCGASIIDGLVEQSTIEFSKKKIPKVVTRIYMPMFKVLSSKKYKVDQRRLEDVDHKKILKKILSKKGIEAANQYVQENKI